jgi:hypothetical protein
MADTRSTGPELDTTRVAYSTGPEPTAWTGWVVFASFMMIMVGSFQIVEGVVALFNNGFYAVGRTGLVVHASYTAWGWWHLILGVLLIVGGIGILAGNMAARILGVALAGLSALSNLLFISANPFWSTIVITVDVLVIYALTVHGRELRDTALDPAQE